MPQELRAPFSCRRAGPADAARVATLNGVIQELHHQALPEEFRQPDARAATDFFGAQLEKEDVLILLAEADGDDVGYLFAEELRRPPNPFTTALDLVYIHHLAVVAGFRRNGVGRELLRAAEDHARNRRLSCVRLDTWAFNQPAQDFFVRMGFQPYNTRMKRDL
jgi:ribosomal protein S18 acetylase RimI-like enzyme